MKDRLERLAKNWASMLLLIGMGILIGALVSLVEVFFAWGLEICIAFYKANWLIMSILMPLIGLLIVFLFRRYGGLSKKGMNLVFEVSQGLTPRIPKRTLVMVIISTWLSHLAGASVGREGVAVQIGAAISNFFSNIYKPFQQKKNIFLVMGIAAGFAGLFGTPFTAAFFALEVLVAGRLEMAALLPAMASAYTAARISYMFGVQKESFAIGAALPFTSISLMARLILLGVIFGLLGGMFAWSLHQAKDWITHKIPDAYKRIGYCSIILALMLIACQGRYGNTGAVLFDAAFTGGTIYPWDFAMKFLFSVVSLSIGFVGGEVTPLFAMGASLGAILAPLLGLPIPFAAALGYAAVFASGTNTWLAGIMIGMELFGYEFFPFFFVTCSLAYMVNNNHSIYSMQRVLYEKDMQPLKIQNPFAFQRDEEVENRSSFAAASLPEAEAAHSSPSNPSWRDSGSETSE